MGKNRKANPVVVTVSGLTPLIVESKILIYPTDTVYGIGCNAYREDLVLRVFEIKKRLLTKPVSVIAPSVEWIYENCMVEGFLQENAIKTYLPGPYTLILKKKDKSFLSLATASGSTVGVRMLDTKIQKIIAKAKVPFITTSANISGDARVLRRLSSLKKELKEKVDYIVLGNANEMSFKSSTIVDLSKGKEKQTERN
ncbi:MAG: threonylcarbamoyl-AMP synthase [Candidatus Aenigmarchaeota archaeon]|nr:threonylcarbamoyl-AMP synthase [Candidatus Aenigmarchaeota archaeon]